MKGSFSFCPNTAIQDGVFVCDTLSYCKLRRMVYHNNMAWGLKFPNTDGTITKTYTINIYFKLTAWGQKKWVRIIDFKNGVSDNGLYYHSEDFGATPFCLQFWPNGDLSPCPYFNTSTYYLLTITRNGANDVIDIYVNGVLFNSYTDNLSLYTGTAGTPIYIFRDDLETSCEIGEANFAYLSFTNVYSDQQTVTDTYNDICGIANSGISDFSFTPQSLCDSSQQVTVTYSGNIPAPGTNYNFTWNWDNGNVTSGSGMGPYTVQWNNSGEKKVKLTVSSSTCGTPVTEEKTLKVSKPVSFQEQKTICEGESYSGHTVQGTYHDTLTTANGCDSIHTLILTVLPKSFSTINQKICKGQSYEGYTVSGTYTDTITATNGCDSIRTLNLSVLDKINTTINHSVCQGQSYEGYTISGTYTDTVTAVNGCDSIRTLNLSVLDKINTTVNQSLCSGRSYEGYSTTGTYIDTFISVMGCDSIRTLHLTINPPVTKNISDSFCQGGKYLLPGGKTVTAPGIYSDTLRTINGCDSIMITNLTLSTSLKDSIIVKDISCNGGEDGSVQILATGVTPTFVFRLNNGLTNKSGRFYQLRAGNYSYSVTDLLGCSLTGTFIIQQPEPVRIKVQPADTAISSGSAVMITASSNFPDAVYLWSPADFLTCNDCANPSASPEKDMDYHLTVTVLSDGKSCIADTIVTVRLVNTLFYVPNAFSPNNDGINDYFNLIVDGSKNITTFSIEIYNRWGEKIFRSEVPTFRWDGTFMNKKVGVGTYIYMIKYRTNGSEEQLIKGDITILK